MRRCPHCKVVKPETEYRMGERKNSIPLYNSFCDDCQKAVNRKAARRYYLRKTVLRPMLAGLDDMPLADADGGEEAAE